MEDSGLLAEPGFELWIMAEVPSVHPEYAEILVRAGIDAISVNLDAIERAERRLMFDAARGEGP